MIYFTIYAIAAGLITHIAAGNEIENDESMAEHHPAHILIACMLVGWMVLPINVILTILK